MEQASIDTKPMSTGAQVLGLSAGTSLVAALVAWVWIPISGIHEMSWNWFPVIADVISSLILDTGWALVAVSVALLAAALVVLTITGLSHSAAANVIRRESIRSAVTSCVLAATAFATLPVWGVIVGTGRLIGFRPIRPDGSVAEVDVGAAEALFSDVVELYVLGTIGVILLACLIGLKSAIDHWMADDEELVASKVANYTESIIRSDTAARGIIRRFQSSRFFSRGIPFHMTAAILRFVLSLVCTYFILIVVAWIWPWAQRPAEDGITVWEWARIFTTQIALLSACMVILPFAPLTAWKWQSAPRIENGEPVRHRGSKLAWVLLVSVGVLLAAAYPLSYFGILMNTEGVVGAQWLGYFVSLIPAVGLLVPGGIGGSSHLFAKIALRGHNFATKSVLYELNKLPTQGEEEEDEIFAIRIGGGLRARRRTWRRFLS